MNDSEEYDVKAYLGAISPTANFWYRPTVLFAAMLNLRSSQEVKSWFETLYQARFEGRGWVDEQFDHMNTVTVLHTLNTKTKIRQYILESLVNGNDQFLIPDHDNRTKISVEHFMNTLIHIVSDEMVPAAMKKPVQDRLLKWINVIINLIGDKETFFQKIDNSVCSNRFKFLGVCLDSILDIHYLAEVLSSAERRRIFVTIQDQLDYKGIRNGKYDRSHPENTIQKRLLWLLYIIQASPQKNERFWADLVGKHDFIDVVSIVASENRFECRDRAFELALQSALSAATQSKLSFTILCDARYKGEYARDKFLAAIEMQSPELLQEKVPFSVEQRLGTTYMPIPVAKLGSHQRADKYIVLTKQEVSLSGYIEVEYHLLTENGVTVHATTSDSLNSTQLAQKVAVAHDQDILKAVCLAVERLEQFKKSILIKDRKS